MKNYFNGFLRISKLPNSINSISCIFTCINYNLWFLWFFNTAKIKSLIILFANCKLEHSFSVAQSLYQFQPIRVDYRAMGNNLGISTYRIWSWIYQSLISELKPSLISILRESYTNCPPNGQLCPAGYTSRSVSGELTIPTGSGHPNQAWTK